ncbi:MAG: hypothetical protein WC792_00235 [Candidatus Micrarchaeia archaeon]
MAAGKAGKAVGALKFIEKHGADFGLTGKALGELESNAEKISAAFSHFVQRPPTHDLLAAIHENINHAGKGLPLLVSPYEPSVKRMLGGKEPDARTRAHFALMTSGSEVLQPGGLAEESRSIYFRRALLESLEAGGLSPRDAERMAFGYLLGNRMYNLHEWHVPENARQIFIHALYLKWAQEKKR